MEIKGVIGARKSESKEICKARSYIQPFNRNNSHKCSMMLLNNIALPEVLSVPCNKKLTGYYFCKAYLSKEHTNISIENILLNITTCEVTHFQWNNFCLTLVNIRDKDKIERFQPSTYQSKCLISEIYSLITVVSLYHSNLIILHLNSETAECYLSKRIDTSFWQIFNWTFSSVPCHKSTGYVVQTNVQKKGFQIQCAYDVGGTHICNDGTCITHSMVCDGIHQCSSGEDEVNCCEERMTDPSIFCKTLLFDCGLKEYIHYSFVCDGKLDCKSKTDEGCDHVIQLNVEKDERKHELDMLFECHDGTKTPSYTLNDLIPDCNSNEQEDEEEYRNIIDNPEKAKQYNCPVADMLSCELGHSRCFYMWQLCLYDRNDLGHLVPCRNGVHLKNCSSFECNGAFKCPKYYCVPFRRVCDGIIDCVFGEDETRCPWEICPGLFRCKYSSICIDPSDICNNEEDCPYSDDEMLCSAPVCTDKCICFGFSLFCSGTKVDFSLSVRYQFATIKSVTILTLKGDLNPLLFSRLFFTLKFVLSSSEIHQICYTKSYSKNNPLSGLKSVLQIEATNNLIKSLFSNCFSENNHLKILNLSLNNVANIEHDTFTNLQMLLCLDVSKNKIDRLVSGIFSHLKLLTYLNLLENPIVFIVADIFSQIEMSVEIHSTDVRFCCMKNIIKTCQVKMTWFESCEDLLDSVVLRVCIWLIGISSFIFNITSTVIHFLSFRHSKKANLSSKLFNFLAIFLNTADICYSVYLIALAGIDLYYRDIFLYHQIPWRQSILCSALTFLSLLSFVLSNFILILITYRKLVGILYPLQTYTQTKSRMSKVSFFGAFAAILVALGLPFLDKSLTGINSNTVCILLSFKNASLAETLSSLLFIILSLFTPVFIVLCYIQMYIVMRKHKKDRKEISLESSQTPKIITSSLLIIKITNIVSWISVAVIYTTTLSGISVPSLLIKCMTVLILPLNSVINPSVFLFSHLKSVCQKFPFLF